MQAHFHLALPPTRQRFADQLRQQCRVGLVGAADQRAGDAHRQLARAPTTSFFQPHQRPAEVVEDAFDLRGEATLRLGLARP
jgi:hypothetical protein